MLSYLLTYLAENRTNVITPTLHLSITWTCCFFLELVKSIGKLFPQPFNENLELSHILSHVCFYLFLLWKQFWKPVLTINSFASNAIIIFHNISFCWHLEPFKMSASSISFLAWYSSFMWGIPVQIYPSILGCVILSLASMNLFPALAGGSLINLAISLRRSKCWRDWLRKQKLSYLFYFPVFASYFY